MKKLRFMLLVVIMLTVSVFALVSQGEEVSVANTSQENEMTVDQEKIDLEARTMEIEPVTSQALNTVILSQSKEDDENIPVSVLATKLEQTEVETEILVNSEESEALVEDSQQAEELPVEEISLSDQVQFIVDNTPLDIRTAEIVLKYAERYNIRPSLILGIMDLESNFDQYLVGTSDDRGYMQVIPGTEKWLVSTYGEELGITYDPSRIFEPDYNIPLAVKYLSVLQKEFDGNDTMMLTAYNRGSGGLRKWYNEHGTYETAYSRVVLKREQKYLGVN